MIFSKFIKFEDGDGLPVVFRKKEIVYIEQSTVQQNSIFVQTENFHHCLLVRYSRASMLKKQLKKIRSQL